MAAGMKPSLGLRTSQQLALTPQLQQSIRLLQMSTAELEQEIEKFLHDNPLLETTDTTGSDQDDRPLESSASEERAEESYAHDDPLPGTA